MTLVTFGPTVSMTSGPWVDAPAVGDGVDDARECADPAVDTRIFVDVRAGDVEGARAGHHDVAQCVGGAVPPIDHRLEVGRRGAQVFVGERADRSGEDR